MIQLGISAFYHDSAACLLIDGKVVYAVEEERFSEIKHDSRFPVRSILWVLTQAGIQDINQVDEICWYEDPKIKKNRVLTTFNKRFFSTFKNRLKYLTGYYLNSPERLLKKHFKYTGNITYVDHHLSHAAFSYYTSPFKQAAILTVDGVGEWETITISRVVRDGKIEKFFDIKFPNSLGMLYSTITAFLGFKPNEGEYKVMGLAPYGNPDKYYKKLNSIFDRTSNKFTIDQKYFTWEYSDKIMFNLDLCKLLDLPPRLKGEEFTQDHKDLAAALQKVYETEFLKLVKIAKNFTRLDNLCLGGGCAYNGVANSKAYKYFKHIHIPFAPSDAGSAIGACLQSYKGPKKDNTSPFLGPEYSDQSIINMLNRENIKHKVYTTESVCRQTANYIKEGKIVAWFQGRMEFGARALGNRSILANPSIPEMREKLNLVIKKREGFRPFAPSVLKSHQSKYFKVVEDIPYMNQVVKASGKFPAATHIDGTSRVHTVTAKQNKKYYRLLQYVEKLTGDPVVLNTSFNLKDQTITMSPEQALSRYLSSDIDVLVLGNVIIEKNGRR